MKRSRGGEPTEPPAEPSATGAAGASEVSEAPVAEKGDVELTQEGEEEEVGEEDPPLAIPEDVE